MSASYFLEVLNRNDEVQARHALPALPVRIGRSYDNDIILDDPHVAPQHAVLELNDTGVLVRDLGSRNGIVHQNRRHAELALDGECIFRLGHSRLRVRPSNFPVAAELPDLTNHNFEGRLPAMLGLLLIALCALARRWIDSPEDGSPISYLMALGASLGIGLLWAGFWAFINRLLDNQIRLGRHLFIAGCALAASQLWLVASNVIGFAFSLEWLTGISSLVEAIIVIGLLYFHLNTVQPRHPQGIKMVCASLMLALGGFVLLGNYQRSDSLKDELYMSQILPPAFRLAPNHKMDDFFNAAQGLKAKADLAGRKPVEAAGANTDE